MNIRLSMKYLGNKKLKANGYVGFSLEKYGIIVILYETLWKVFQRILYILISIIHLMR